MQLLVLCGELVLLSLLPVQQRVSQTGRHYVCMVRPSCCCYSCCCCSFAPAICAGTASMSALLGSTAVPPGTYTPTALIGRVTRRQVTPGIVSTLMSPPRCASWKARMLAYATSNARVTSSGSSGQGRSWGGGECEEVADEGEGVCADCCSAALV